MSKNITYVLIHSPLVGPLTWKLVKDEMQQRGLHVITPALTDHQNSRLPYWQQHAQAIVASLHHLPKNRRLVWVAHSGAGPLLPVMSQTADRAPAAYVFVDAGVPRPGLSRLDLMRLQDSELADGFQQTLIQSERFPMWTEQDLAELIPDDACRRQMVSEIQPRSRPFFTEPIPVFAGWPDASCAYIKFSAPYDWDFRQAQKQGWPVYENDAGHFHMLVDAKGVTAVILQALSQMS